MKHWDFKVFISDNNVNEIEDWLQSMPVKFSAKVGRTIVHLEVQKDMRCGYFKKYKGYSNIYELRFTNNNIQYRPLGCFGPGENEFTLLVLAIEKGSRLKPRNVLKTAKERCKLISQDRRYIDDFV